LIGRKLGMLSRHLDYSKDLQLVQRKVRLLLLNKKDNIRLTKMMEVVDHTTHGLNGKVMVED